jgi:hypothetical protein
MMRHRLRSDADLENMIGLVRRDSTAARVGRRYSRQEIRELEDRFVPWLKAQRAWDARRARSS